MHLRLPGPFEMVVDSGPVCLAGRVYARTRQLLADELGVDPSRVSRLLALTNSGGVCAVRHP